jgi:hypothetical protein
MDLALNALISVNKNGVENLLRSYNYKVPLFSSGLYNSLISAMAQNSAFTNDILTLLKQASNQPWKYADDGSGDDTASIISGALTGLGMITTTWQNTANIKATATKSNTTLVVVGAVLGGIVLLGIMTIIVVKSTKK